MSESGGLAEDGDEVDLRRGSAGGGGGGSKGEEEGEGERERELAEKTPFERNDGEEAVGSLSANSREPPSETLVVPGASCEVTTTASRPTSSWWLSGADLRAVAADSRAGVLL